MSLLAGVRGAYERSRYYTQMKLELWEIVFEIMAQTKTTSENNDIEARAPTNQFELRPSASRRDFEFGSK